MVSPCFFFQMTYLYNMLFGLLEDSSWIYFVHTYVVPLYTYWYYFGPLLLVLVPTLRLSYGTIKYFVKVLLLVCTEVADFLVETTTNTATKSMKRRHTRTLQSEVSDGDSDDNEPADTSVYNVVSAEDVIDNVQRMVTKAARYCILLFLLLLPIWFAVSIPFIYFNNHAECYQDYLGYMNNVKECEERGYTAPDFRDLCIRSKKEVQKSVIYCALEGSMDDMQKFFLNTLCSPLVIVYLCIIIALGLVRYGLRLAKQRDGSSKWYPTPVNTDRNRMMKNVTLYEGKPKECLLKME